MGNTNQPQQQPQGQQQSLDTNERMEQSTQSTIMKDQSAQPDRNVQVPGFEPTGDQELDDIEREVQIAYNELNNAIDELDKDIDKIIDEFKKELEV